MVIYKYYLNKHKNGQKSKNNKSNQMNRKKLEIFNRLSSIKILKKIFNKKLQTRQILNKIKQILIINYH